MQRYSTFFRLISIILTVALLMTTTTFSILAAEAAEAIGELAADLSAGQENPETAEIAETERLGDLLRRLSEYDSFTDAEKKLVLSALGMAVDEESVRIAQENQAEQHRLFDAMPYTARCELQIHGWAEDGKTYADLSDTQKQTVLDYLELDHARAAEYAARFAALEAAGYDLFEAMQIMSITKTISSRSMRRLRSTGITMRARIATQMSAHLRILRRCLTRHMPQIPTQKQLPRRRQPRAIFPPI